MVKLIRKSTHPQRHKGQNEQSSDEAASQLCIITTTDFFGSHLPVVDFALCARGAIAAYTVAVGKASKQNQKKRSLV